MIYDLKETTIYMERKTIKGKGKFQEKNGFLAYYYSYWQASVKKRGRKKKGEREKERGERL